MLTLAAESPSFLQVRQTSWLVSDDYYVPPQVSLADSLHDALAMDATAVGAPGDAALSAEEGAAIAHGTEEGLLQEENSGPTRAVSLSFLTRETDSVPVPDSVGSMADVLKRSDNINNTSSVITKSLQHDLSLVAQERSSQQKRTRKKNHENVSVGSERAVQGVTTRAGASSSRGNRPGVRPAEEKHVGAAASARKNHSATGGEQTQTDSDIVEKAPRSSHDIVSASSPTKQERNGSRRSGSGPPGPPHAVSAVLPPPPPAVHAAPPPSEKSVDSENSRLAEKFLGVYANLVDDTSAPGDFLNNQILLPPGTTEVFARLVPAGRDETQHSSSGRRVVLFAKRTKAVGDRDEHKQQSGSTVSIASDWRSLSSFLSGAGGGVAARAQHQQEIFFARAKASSTKRRGGGAQHPGRTMAKQKLKMRFRSTLARAHAEDSAKAARAKAASGADRLAQIMSNYLSKTGVFVPRGRSKKYTTTGQEQHTMIALVDSTPLSTGDGAAEKRASTTTSTHQNWGELTKKFADDLDDELNPVDIKKSAKANVSEKPPATNPAPPQSGLKKVENLHKDLIAYLKHKAPVAPAPAPRTAESSPPAVHSFSTKMPADIEIERYEAEHKDELGFKIAPVAPVVPDSTKIGFESSFAHLLGSLEGAGAHHPRHMTAPRVPRATVVVTPPTKLPAADAKKLDELFARAKVEVGGPLGGDAGQKKDGSVSSVAATPNHAGASSRSGARVVSPSSSGPRPVTTPAMTHQLEMMRASTNSHDKRRINQKKSEDEEERVETAATSPLKAVVEAVNENPKKEKDRKDDHHEPQAVPGPKSSSRVVAPPSPAKSSEEPAAAPHPHVDTTHPRGAHDAVPATRRQSTTKLLQEAVRSSGNGNLFSAEEESATKKLNALSDRMHFADVERVLQTGKNRENKVQQAKRSAAAKRAVARDERLAEGKKWLSGMAAHAVPGGGYLMHLPPAPVSPPHGAKVKRRVSASDQHDQHINQEGGVSARTEKKTATTPRLPGVGKLAQLANELFDDSAPAGVRSESRKTVVPLSAWLHPSPSEGPSAPSADRRSTTTSQAALAKSDEKSPTMNPNKGQAAAQQENLLRDAEAAFDADDDEQTSSSKTDDKLRTYLSKKNAMLQVVTSGDAAEAFDQLDVTNLFASKRGALVPASTSTYDVVAPSSHGGPGAVAKVSSSLVSVGAAASTTASSWADLTAAFHQLKRQKQFYGKKRDVHEGDSNAYERALFGGV